MTLSLHIAGIGASAGGLEAMLEMFARLRPTGRIAYVVAQHMADDGHSDLVVRLIQRSSAMTVVLAENGMRLRPDQVFVIPAGKDGQLAGSQIILADPDPENLSTPSVNTLFASIARSAGPRAIGIILSGAGSDGAVGCRAIKGGGGLTLAQDPLEAKMDGMPGAAIRAKAVDHVLPVEKICETLASLFSAATTAEAELPPPPQTHEELRHVIESINKITGIDFSQYKEETLLRRLEKRKETVGAVSAEAYRRLIGRDPEELRILQQQFLVSVSSFFRDPASFAALERALGEWLGKKPAGEPIRVWVPGCAAGEEPYSLAIILQEVAAAIGRQFPITIIASDLNPQALTLARDGIYQKTAFKETGDLRRNKYFSPKGQQFEIKPAVKSCVSFEQRDVFTGDPPTDLDLVSCRNLLIYIKSQLQDDLIKQFHQALRPQGLLFIGQSESLGFLGNSLFAPVDLYHRLFRRRG
ncbi:MAG TPA: chemotaxis protein [Rhodospirillaceae bacterium]|nr:chemotaxis protein [Rhodospirillaceae bacterium]